MKTILLQMWFYKQFFSIWKLFFKCIILVYNCFHFKSVFEFVFLILMQWLSQVLVKYWQNGYFYVDITYIIVKWSTKKSRKLFEYNTKVLTSLQKNIKSSLLKFSLLQFSKQNDILIHYVDNIYKHDLHKVILEKYGFGNLWIINSKINVLQLLICIINEINSW